MPIVSQLIPPRTTDAREINEFYRQVSLHAGTHQQGTLIPSGNYIPRWTGDKYLHSTSGLWWISTGTGATDWSPMFDYISIQSFCRGNGTDDDAPEFQEAIAIIKAQGGGALYVPTPDSIYTLNSKLTIDFDNFTMFGDGASSRVKTNIATGPVIEFVGVSAASPVSGFSLSNLYFMANTAHTSGSFLTLTSCVNVNVESIFAGSYKQFVTAGVNTEANNAMRLYFDDIEFNSNGGNCFDLVSGAILVVTDSFFNGITSATEALIYQGDVNYNWDGVKFNGCTCEQWPTIVLVSGAGIANLRYTENLTDRVKNYGVYCGPYTGGNANHWVISDNQFDGNTSGGDPYGIVLTEDNGGAVENISIRGNIIRTFDNEGIRIETGCENVIANGNILQNCGMAGVPGVTVEAVTEGVIVDGNVINGDLAMTYGISWGGAGTGRVQGDNSITGYATAAVGGVA